MKRKILFAIAALTGSLHLHAQTFVLDPGNVDTVYAPANTLTIFDIYPVNITSGDIIFQWSRVSVNVPVGWDYSLCDYGSCYTGIPNQGTMDTVNASEMGLLGLNINPYGIPGQGIVKLYVFDSNFPNDGDTVTWVVNAGAAEIAENASLRFNCYPNPVENALTISSPEIQAGDLYAIISLNGQYVLSGQLPSSKIVSFDELPSGLYFLQIHSGSKMYTEKIVKR